MTVYLYYNYCTAYQTTIVRKSDVGQIIIYPNCHAIYTHNRFSISDKDLFHILYRMRGLTHVSQALLQSKHDHRNSNVFNSTRAIFFFGTPHQGFGDELLLQMVEGVSDGDLSAWKSFINQLDEGSNLLRTQRDDIIYLLGPTSDIDVISFYETKATLGLRKVSNRTSFLVDIIKMWFRLPSCSLVY
jgi:hypothetical protein